MSKNTISKFITRAAVAAASVQFSHAESASEAGKTPKTGLKISDFATKIPLEPSQFKRSPNRGEVLAGKQALYTPDPDKLKELSGLLSSRIGSEVHISADDAVMKRGSSKTRNKEYYVGSVKDLGKINELEELKASRRIGGRSVHEPLQGRTVFITGGNAGIGLDTAKYLHQLGAEAHISGRNEATLKAAVEEIGEGSHAIKADVSKIAECEAQFATFKASGKKIDVLFVNAGIFDITDVTTISPEKYDEMMNINTRGAFFTIQKALPYLADGAVIILNSSIASELPDAKNGVYSASKRALNNFVVSFASDPELIKRRIRVVGIAPGLTDTNIFKNALGSEEAATTFKEGTISSIPLGRASTTREMAETVAFIVGNPSVNAETIHINGGLKNVRGLVPNMGKGGR